MGPVANLFIYNSEKETIMKHSYKLAAGALVALSMGFAAVAYAHPGFMGGGMGTGMRGGMGPGMMGGMGPRTMGPGFAGPIAGQQLMTPEERTALIEKMRSAKTPEERQKLAEANRTEMEKRAKDKGITLPQTPGPRAGFGPNFAPPSAGTR